MVFFVRRLAIRVTQARWNGEEALDVNHAKALGLLRFWELLTQSGRALERYFAPNRDIGVRVQKALPVGHPSGRFAGLLESDPKI